MNNSRRKYALVRLGKKNDVLYSEYQRAKQHPLTIPEMREIIANVIERNEGKRPSLVASKIMQRLADHGKEGEEYADLL